MNALKQNMNSILVCLFELIIGILLLINPVGFTAGIITIFGIALIILGIIDLIQYFRTGAEEASRGTQMTTGLIALAAGAFCAFRTQWIIITFPVITVFYGIVVLLAGMSKVQWTVDMLRLKSGKWFLCAISAAVSLVCGVLIVTNPFTSTAVLWTFISVSLIIEAVFDIVALIVGKSAAGEIGGNG